MTKKDILTHITAYKLQEIAAAKAAHPYKDMLQAAKAAPPPRGFYAALHRQHIVNKAANKGGDKKPALIAEIKKSSPSKGLIRADFDPPQLARAYAEGGATCLSVLTDTPSFGGTLADLRAVRAACALPILRKDFMFDVYQIAEARYWGADAILLIMAAISDHQARQLADAAAQLALDVVFEIHTIEELHRARPFKPALLGINNRNLTNFTTDLQVTKQLLPHAPAGALLISESGIATHADVQQLMGAGVAAFLVGESLMRQADLCRATQQLLGLKPV